MSTEKVHKALFLLLSRTYSFILRPIFQNRRLTMNILYVDPVFGLSGDMMISALIDAGLPFGELEQLFKKIPLPMPAIRPVKRAHGVFDGTGLHIDSSPIHLTIREMEDIIDKIGETEKVRKDARFLRPGRSPNGQQGQGQDRKKSR
jgi:hypothetical protein